MSDRRFVRLATTSARLLVGTVVALAFVIGVVTAVHAPWPAVERDPVAIDAAPAPAPAVVACTGPIVLAGRDATSAAGISVVVPQAAVAGVLPGQDDAAESRLEPRVSATVVDGAGGAVYSALPADGGRADVAAAGSSQVDASDIRGFAASACRQPLLESWLVGGSTAVGASDLVLLANPGSVPATVQLTVYGVEGGRIPPGGADLVVPAGGQLIVPLAGIAGGEESPVIRVDAVGAPVQAALQSSATRTLLPVGVDQFGVSATPAAALTIAGLTVAGTASGTGGAADEPTTVVRMLSPGADAQVSVTATEVGSAGTPEPVTAALTAGVPLTLDLGPLPAGEYTVQVAADQPVVAAAWHATGFGENADFAWLTPSPVVEVPSLFAVAAGPDPVLVLANDSGSATAVSVAAVGGGTSEQVTVPAAGSLSLRVSPETVYLLDPGAGGSIRAAVSFSADGALAAYPVWPADTAAEAVRVYP